MRSRQAIQKMYLQSCIRSNNQTIPQDGVPVFNVWATKTQEKRRKSKIRSQRRFNGSQYNKPWWLLIALSFLVKHHVVTVLCYQPTTKRGCFPPPAFMEDWAGNSHPSTVSCTHWNAKVLPKSFLAALKLDSLAGGLLRRRNWWGVCMNFSCCHWK